MPVLPTSHFIIPNLPMDRRQLGKYDVLCRLSTGGMSEIYLAVQSGVGGFNKLVVLKTILPDIGGEEDFVRMFLDEARITAAFNHPNIAHVYELDTAESTLFMAMEFVQGCTLVEMARACRQAKETIPIGLTLASVRDTALALHYAHTFVDARGRRQIVIHRDVAEKNIMVTYEGVTKLLDFGIAKALGRSGHTSVGMVKGTSGYMSPEQIRGEPLDARSDIFSLGVVLHECLTGLRLFHGKNPEDGMKAALHTGVSPPSKWNKEVRPELDAIVLKALQRDREARFGTALEFARSVEKVGAGLIWHPEQIGDLVVRHFAERRAETRRVIENAFGGEATGEIRVQSLIARIKSDRKSGSLPQAVPSAPVPVVSPQLVAPVNANASSNSTTTQPSIQHATLDTNPARPRSLKANSSPVPAPPPTPPVRPAGVTAEVDINITPHANFDEDESEAKTIPAAALPPEIKELRRQLRAQAEARKNQDADDDERTVPLPTGGFRLPPGVTKPPQPVQRLFVPPPVPSAPPPVQPAAQAAQPTTQPLTMQPPQAPAVAPPPVASAPRRRANTSETLSITQQQPPEAARAPTTLAQTHDPLPLAHPPPPTDPSPSGRQSADDFVPTTSIARPSLGGSQEISASQQQLSDGDREAVRTRRGGLVVILVLLVVIALVGLLVLLDIIPIALPTRGSHSTAPHATLKRSD